MQEVEPNRKCFHDYVIEMLLSLSFNFEIIYIRQYKYKSEINNRLYLDIGFALRIHFLSRSLILCCSPPVTLVFPRNIFLYLHSRTRFGCLPPTSLSPSITDDFNH